MLCCLGGGPKTPPSNSVNTCATCATCDSLSPARAESLASTSLTTRSKSLQSISPTLSSTRTSPISSTRASPTRISPPSAPYPKDKTINAYQLSNLITFIETSHPAQYSTSQLRIFHDISKFAIEQKPYLKDLYGTDSNVPSGPSAAPSATTSASASAELRPNDSI
jgi:hypothetical protein